MRTQVTRFLAVMLSAIACAIGAASATAEEIVSVEPLELLSAEELRELVGPVALYPDDLLAIVLPASAYPLQIVAAARYRQRAENDSTVEPDKDWDESIVALLNYPEALALLNDDIDWTWELGQAVLSQEADVLSAVQTFRTDAYAAGNLSSDERQKVAVSDSTVTIEPVDTEVVYVPYYEPDLVTVYQPRRVYHYYSTAYPVYYYPYASYHSVYDHHFWGISSFFALSWSSHHLNHYLHGHRGHRYYGRKYHNNHFRHTRFYVSPRAHQRRWAHRYDHRRFGRHTTAPRRDSRWYANRHHAGARPYARGRSQADKHGHYRQQRPKQRHIERRGRHQYDQAALNRRADGRSARRAQRNARNPNDPQVHPRRTRNSDAQPTGRQRLERQRARQREEVRNPRALAQQRRSPQQRERANQRREARAINQTRDQHRQAQPRREQRRAIAQRPAQPPQARARRDAQRAAPRQRPQQRPVMPRQQQRAQQAPQRIARAQPRPQQRRARPASPVRQRAQVQPRAERKAQPRAEPRTQPQRGVRSGRSGRHMERSR